MTANNSIIIFEYDPETGLNQILPERIKTCKSREILKNYDKKHLVQISTYNDPDDRINSCLYNNTKYT